jgi:hypothetical protein
MAPRRWMVRHLAPGDLWVIDTAYRRAFRRQRELHMLLGFLTSGLSLDLLLIFHGMSCLPRQMVELFEAVHRCPQPRIEGVQQCCSFHCLCRHEGSYDGKTWETNRIAISISLDAFLRSSRSLKPSSSCCLPSSPPSIFKPATGSPVSTPAAMSNACLAASSGCRLLATGRQSCARQRAIVE